MTRAVSDALGFAVVFAIVVGSVALVYTFGIGALTDLQHAQQAENVERGFQTLADNVDDVHQEGAPARSTELALSGGQLSTTETVSFVVNVSGNTTAVSVTPVRYRRGATTLHYVGGAVLRSDRRATVLQSSPPFRFDDEHTVLSVVDTRPVEPAGESIGGEGTVLVVTRRSGPPSVTRLARNESDPVPFRFSVTSPRYRAWNRSLAAQNLTFVSTDPANQTVTYRSETEALYVRTTTVEVELKR